VYLQPLLRNPPRKLPNSVRLHGGYLRRPRSPSLVPIESSYATLINTNLYHILYRFRDIAFERSKNRYIRLPLLGLTHNEGIPLGAISVKFLYKGHGWPITTWRRNIAENFNRLSRVHERYRRHTTEQTDDRQTDGRWHIATFTFAKMLIGSSRKYYHSWNAGCFFVSLDTEVPILEVICNLHLDYEDTILKKDKKLIRR